MHSIDVTDSAIILHTHWEDKDSAAALPGARWSKDLYAWVLPATPSTWARVKALYPEHAQPCWLDDMLAKRANARLHQPLDYASDMPPWAHQRLATAFATRMDAALLHCWMGTGKTKITLDALRARGHRTTLVICPASVITVWQSEAEKHARGVFNVLALDGSKSTTKRAIILANAPADKPLLAVVNYEAAWQRSLGDKVAETSWDCIVLDESHRIKSPSAKCSRFVAKLSAKHRLCLTGTPMPHSPLDLYGQYRFLDPGVFGTRFADFRERYAIMGGYERHQIVGWQREEELRALMDTLRLHVTADVLDLPPLQTLDRSCSLEPEARRVYDSMERQLIAEVEGGTVTAANALVKLLRLQQLTGGAVPRDEDEGKLTEVSKAKESLLAEMLEDLAEERVVVFTRFHHDIEVVRRVAGDATGEISGQRNEYEGWKAGRFRVLAVQIQAGGLGIDLTEARVAIFYSLGYSLGEYDQAVARVHRPGQTRPTVVYRLLAEHSVDEKIVLALAKRADVVRSIIGDMKGVQA